VLLRIRRMPAEACTFEHVLCAQLQHMPDTVRHVLELSVPAEHDPA